MVIARISLQEEKEKFVDILTFENHHARHANEKAIQSLSTADSIKGACDTTAKGVLDGTSGTSADVPGVGLKLVSVSFCNKMCGWERGIKEKLKQITKNIEKKGEEKDKKGKKKKIKSIIKVRTS